MADAGSVGSGKNKRTDQRIIAGFERIKKQFRIGQRNQICCSCWLPCDLL